MANTKSAAKRARQSVKRHARNKSILSSVKTQVRKAREAITKADAGAIDRELKGAEASLAKAASKGALPKRTASRRTSRLAKAAHAAKQPKA